MKEKSRNLRWTINQRIRMSSNLEIGWAKRRKNQNTIKLLNPKTTRSHPININLIMSCLYIQFTPNLNTNLRHMIRDTRQKVLRRDRLGQTMKKLRQKGMM
jgi:hypothetical protein